ncbi:hypothetical protein K4A83_16915, partial [Spirulina subsalsa FACHB-351]
LPDFKKRSGIQPPPPPQTQLAEELDLSAEHLSSALRQELSQRITSPSPSSKFITPESTQSPSPTLNPQPPKKRKSLASIDLPNFPRYRSAQN